MGLVSIERWEASIDFRTCPRCRFLHGQEFPEGQGPQPPVHRNCRCQRIAVRQIDELRPEGKIALALLAAAALEAIRRLVDIGGDDDDADAQEKPAGGGGGSGTGATR